MRFSPFPIKKRKSCKMKTIAIKLIELYQVLFSAVLKNFLGSPHFCRFRPTCSEYAKIKIKEDGILKGSFQALIRLAKCQPFGKVAYE